MRARQLKNGTWTIKDVDAETLNAVAELLDAGIKDKCNDREYWGMIGKAQTVSSFFKTLLEWRNDK